MAKGLHQINHYLESLLSNQSLAELREKISPSSGEPYPCIPGGTRVEAEALDRRWNLLGSPPELRSIIEDPQAREFKESYRNNIENFIGTVKVPVGLVGPLKVNGLFANGVYYLPLATTESSLVASYCRGAKLISGAGGCTAMVLNEGVSRTPGFAFPTAIDAGEFVIWGISQIENFKRVAESTTQHGRLTDVRVTFEGNHVYLHFEMTTGDASGQNMVTLATDAICNYIVEHSPIRPDYYYVEANMSGDKKATFQSFTSVRGKKVCVEITLPRTKVEHILNTTPEEMVNCWRMSTVGGVLSGGIGVQGHYANGLTALFMATGQDVACIAEAAVGVTRLELNADADLYATVTLPNLIVGTVGGGTGLPSQKSCLEMIGLPARDKSRAFAEICGSLALAGELSIIGAISAGQFAKAHKSLARDKPRKRKQGHAHAI